MLGALSGVFQSTLPAAIKKIKRNPPLANEVHVGKGVISIAIFASAFFWSKVPETTRFPSVSCRDCLGERCGTWQTKVVVVGCQDTVKAFFETFYTCRTWNVLSVSSFVQLASVTSRTWRSQNPTDEKNYRCVKWTNKKGYISVFQKPSKDKAFLVEVICKTVKIICITNQEHLTFFWRPLDVIIMASKVWMHQIRTSPMLFCCRFRGKMATLLSVSTYPLCMECMKSAYSLWTTFGHLHCLKLLRCVYTKQCNHKNLNKVNNNLHWATSQRSKTPCILARLIIHSCRTLCPVLFVQPNQLSPVTGFLIPEHWYDGKVLVIGIPHFSRDLGPTWMVGNIITVNSTVISGQIQSCGASCCDEGFNRHIVHAKCAYSLLGAWNSALSSEFQGLQIGETWHVSI